VSPSKPARILTLFLSNGGSLSRWRKEGILSREILLYQTLLKQGVFDRVRIFSYDARDVALVAEDPVYAGIEMLTPRAGALYGGRAALWSLAGVVRHRAAIGGSAWLKTNQVSGAWAAVAARVITGRALMIRLGYVLSRRFALNGKRLQAMFARWVEKAAFAAADSIVVTSEAAAAPLKADPATAGKTHLGPDVCRRLGVRRQGRVSVRRTGDLHRPPGAAEKHPQPGSRLPARGDRPGSDRGRLPGTRGARAGRRAGLADPPAGPHAQRGAARANCAPTPCSPCRPCTKACPRC
jgi:hypothetical protein